MATFNQNNQKVYGNQYMGDTVNVTHGERSPIDARTVAREFDRALTAVRDLQVSAATREQVTAELVTARGELEAGDTGAARGRLAALLAMGGTVAEIVNHLAGAVQVFLGD
ncbi:hypothetical protein Sru01_07080 [Sphaerisporangium rufum]|uniref:Uncharacterized protein n=1 Tax=Sphaerisporangium rufum TaxID=1381558 RepID=A0A919QX42_9ACTN|nr:hypothetical protein [Sphaerisporangium rufum]GII75726.1 hypothetical protein Sru01_07080 [Sphaerisporangium rufum]